MTEQDGDISLDLQREFGAAGVVPQKTKDDVHTVWVSANRVKDVLRHLKYRSPRPYRMLYDLTAVDERLRNSRADRQGCGFSLVYHLLSVDRNQDIRVKVPLTGDFPCVESCVDIWPSANWYEREVWDMFGIRFEGHPDLRRILLPPTWIGHPLRKEHPARATEMGPFQLSEEKAESEELALRFDPEQWGMKPLDHTKYMFLNMGPQHPSTHGVFRLVLALDAEEIVDVALDIGYHHRGAEKMAERQTWHTFIPYTDRIDYLGGAMNNFPYVLAVEKLAGIEVPDRVKVIRVMMAEFFRIASHLVFYGTFVQDVGAMSPVFFTFNDRERIFGIVEAVCGGRMHPMWFRIGGVANDLPRGWDSLVRDFVNYFPARLREYETLALKNRILKARTVGIAEYSTEEAIEWGVTGPGLRSTGCEWDFRKKRPYSGYDQLDFDIPTGTRGDCYDRSVVRVEEMRQSLRIIEQCLEHMPEGPYKADHPLAMPPRKERTMHDIETLITHFVNVTWGPVIPPGEALCHVEATKGDNGYYLVSDGNTSPYRARIRTPSFPHLQMIPAVAKGLTVADLVAFLGSIDYVMADVDR
ncbi:MAG: NADH-quinone oxidoreductase subunit C/D [Thermodesulfobacteriota bacterium]